MIIRFSYILSIFLVMITSFPVFASDILDCVKGNYVTPYYSDTGLPDPAENGKYKFNVISYGKQPFLFNLYEPDIIAPTVDLPNFLGDYSRNQGYKSDAYHQFNNQNLGLESKVWLPINDKPLPLVIITHGNSAPGFDYLGELLASRGHVVVQVNQTYLNGLWGENGARAWLLLEHLKQLKKWNKKIGHTFYNKLDFDRIALIGMSRGGEAVALAAAFNQWETIPISNELTEFDFNIKSVIALAPMDGQYHHVNGPNKLRNVNYLVLQGGHDADVYQFLGSQQWHRTYFDDGENYFKQSIYIYRANHINFNQDMSDDFRWGSENDFYSKLLKPEEQESLTKFYVSAFLEVTLANKKEYLEVLKKPVVREFSLPNDIYVSRYLSSDYTIIEDFERAKNHKIVEKAVTKNTLTQATNNIMAEKLRNGTNTSNNVLKVELNKGIESRISIKLLKHQVLHNNRSGKFNLIFSIALASSKMHRECKKYNLFSDASIELRDKSALLFNGDLSTAGTVAPQLVSDFSELEKGGVKYAPTEPVLQTFTLPIEFSTATNIDNELELVFVFNPKVETIIILDDIGVTNQL